MSNEQTWRDKMRLQFSEVIRLFFNQGDELELKPVKTFFEGDEYFVYGVTYSLDFIPEVILDITDKESEAILVADLVKELSFFYFKIGDLFFDFTVVLDVDAIYLVPLEATYRDELCFSSPSDEGDRSE